MKISLERYVHYVQYRIKKEVQIVLPQCSWRSNWVICYYILEQIGRFNNNHTVLKFAKLYERYCTIVNCKCLTGWGLQHPTSYIWGILSCSIYKPFNNITQWQREWHASPIQTCPWPWADRKYRNHTESYLLQNPKMYDHGAKSTNNGYWKPRPQKSALGTTAVRENRPRNVGVYNVSPTIESGATTTCHPGSTGGSDSGCPYQWETVISGRISISSVPRHDLRSLVEQFTR